ncbi:MAG TPA: hypothetical protein PK263_04965 [bacterium]|nr:hypothetical protein [bacterium]
MISKPEEVVKSSSELLSDRMTYADFFKTRMALANAFCDTAKTYIQISSAALALPLLFTQALFGKSVAECGLHTIGSVPCSLLLSWLSFLLAIGFGLTYQWLTIRRIWDQLHKDHLTPENCKDWGFRTTPGIPKFEWLNRSFIYGGMVGLFYLGAILFVVFAASKLA